jgi:nucleoside-diphosphate-sugar epimerase
MRKALVTGATGFVGRHLVEALLRDGNLAVRALVRTTSPALPREVECFHADVTRDDDVPIAAAVAGCDVVFHCAGAVGDQVSWENGKAVNVEGTRRVARAVRQASVARMVHVSSVAVYGFDAGTFGEESPRVRVDEPYIDTKSEGEAVCEAELGDAVRLVTVRPAIIYGPGDSGMLPRLAELLRKGVPMLGDGGAPVGLVHITDVVAALLAAARYEGAERVFNVAGPDDISWSELTQKVALALGLRVPKSMPQPVAMMVAHMLRWLSLVGLMKAPPLTPFAVKFLTQHRKYPTGALTRELGIRPRVHVSEGLSAAIALLAPTETGPLPA